MNSKKEIYGKLEVTGNAYNITHARKFVPLGEISISDKRECFNFALDMAYGEGKHRAHRSGGKKERSAGEIFINTFQGKLAEFALYRYLQGYKIESSYPDLSVEGLGKWDSFDVECFGAHIAVKSTKFFGQLLLLEKKDWSDTGEYLPNKTDEVNHYDLFVLIRLSPDGNKIMEKSNLLQIENVEPDILKRIIFERKWEYDIAGYIIEKDLLRLIDKKYILPQDAMLNGKTRMDADNYYVQAGDMRESSDMIDRLRYYASKLESSKLNGERNG